MFSFPCISIFLPLVVEQSYALCSLPRKVCGKTENRRAKNLCRELKLLGSKDLQAWSGLYRPERKTILLEQESDRERFVYLRNRGHLCPSSQQMFQARPLRKKSRCVQVEGTQNSLVTDAHVSWVAQQQGTWTNEVSEASSKDQWQMGPSNTLTLYKTLKG